VYSIFFISMMCISRTVYGCGELGFTAKRNQMTSEADQAFYLNSSQF
jgi:hypothetical protein